MPIVKATESAAAAAACFRCIFRGMWSWAAQGFHQLTRVYTISLPAVPRWLASPVARSAWRSAP